MRHVSFVLLVLRGTSTLNMAMCSSAEMEQDHLSAKKQGHNWLNKFRSLERFNLHLDCDPQSAVKRASECNRNRRQGEFQLWQHRSWWCTGQPAAMCKHLGSILLTPRLESLQSDATKYDTHSLTHSKV